MTPDQLDDAGWSPEQWDALNGLARATVDKHGRVRRLIPEGPKMPGAYTVSAPKYIAGPPPRYKTDEGSKAVVRMRAKFAIAAEQVGDLDLVGRMVVGRARTLAAAADDVLVNGGAVVGSYGSGDDVHAVGLVAGTVGLAAGGSVGDPKPFDAIAKAVGVLRTAGRIGPFAGVFSAALWNALVLETAGGGSRDGIDRAAELLEADRSFIGLVKDGGAAKPFGVIFEPSATAVDLVTVHPPRIAFVHFADGDLVLRVEEAFFLRVMDETALAKAEVGA